MAEPAPHELDTEQAWHSIPAPEVLELLKTQSSGLSADEAALRLKAQGPNQLEDASPPSVLSLIVYQFQSPLIYILFLAGAATLLLQEWVDAAVIFAVLGLNALIGFTQERRAELAVHALGKLVSPKARVIRDRQDHDIPSVDLVRGDVVRLESGMKVPADLRLIRTTNLRVDESLLTGESLPVSKDPEPVEPGAAVADRRGMVHAGSVVLSGRATAVVVGTGTSTQIGAIAKGIRQTRRGETPLQQRMNRLATIVGVVVAISAVLAMIIGIVLGESWTDMFLIAVALAVASVPEGLPVVFTITLAVGVRRMAARNAIIRRLPAVETLGSTTVIGSDKTGTLTENRMRAVALRIGDQAVDLDHPSHEAPSLDRVARIAILSSEAVLGSETTNETGDPTEIALLELARRLGAEPAQVRAQYRSLHEIPFESELRYAATFGELDDQRWVMTKGAPERILEMCTTQADGEPLDPERVRQAIADLASEGLRVLGLASRRLSPEEPLTDQSLRELDLAGLVGLMDPPREGVAEAIQGCHEAGIRVIMMTGDHASTAQAIARQIGLLTDGGRTITGAELDQLDELDLAEQLSEIAVFARTSPEQKLRIVHALEEAGEIVAVTGDGVNDAPALKAAAIGVAMGRGGTDVAREASDMVLTDDNFVSIHAAVETGRVTFANLRKVTFFLLSTGAGSIGAILGSLVLGMSLPMVPAQLLWMNLVTNGLQDLALAFEPGEADVRTAPPRPRTEGIVSWLLWERTVISGIVLAIGTLWMFQDVLGRTDSLEEARTVALTTMVLFQVFQVGNARSEFRSVFSKSPFSNPFLFLATLAALGVHLLALHWSPLQTVLRVVPITDPWTWVRMIAVASSILFVIEMHKLIRSAARKAARSRSQA
ncbi:MAG: HAD family hydrolase [Deltaproteobacteria bacterium]|nr:MAG: HAD family hydrolase [Deltaproteobacteria bacterium]